MRGDFLHAVDAEGFSVRLTVREQISRLPKGAFMRSRRRFIVESTLAAATAVVAPNLAARAAVQAPKLAPAELRLETFARLINATFWTSSADARRIELRLTAAESVPAAHGEQFILVFRGPRDFVLRQDTYWLEQSDLGKFPIFIVPAASIGPAAPAYVAVFNRLGHRPSKPAGPGVHAT